jgi:hypothetical protein
LPLFNHHFDFCVGAGANLSDFSKSPFDALLELIRPLTFSELSFRSFWRIRQFLESSFQAIHVAVEFSPFSGGFRRGGRGFEIDGFDIRLSTRQFFAQGIFQPLKFLISHFAFIPSCCHLLATEAFADYIDNRVESAVGVRLRVKQLS